MRSEISSTTTIGAIRTVALYEGLKGLLVLAVASGLTLVHRDVHDLAVRLVEHVHLDPEAKYPSIFLNAAAHLQDSRLVLVALGAVAYAGFHLIEAYGLWYGRAWAEVLAAGSAGIYLPFELYELTQRATPLRAGFLLANTAVVAVMLAALYRRRRLEGTAAEA